MVGIHTLLLVIALVAFAAECLWHRSLLAGGLACWVLALLLGGR
jgi:hypothetical protein